MKSTKRIFFHDIVGKASKETTTQKPVEFRGTSATEFARWEKEFRTVLRKTVGPSGAVPLRPAVVERREFRDYIREKVIYDVEQGLSACAWLCRPKKTAGNKKLPAVVVCHGHGPGKDPLIGLFGGIPTVEYHKMVSVRLARAGYVTLSPDRRGYGDCSSFIKGYPLATDLTALDSFYRKTRGVPLLALNVRDTFRAADFLAGRTDVDPGRIGCFGIESGAAVASVAAALDDRIKAVSLTTFLKEEADGRGTDMLYSPGISLAPLLEGKGGPLDVCALVCPRPIQIQLPEADPVISPVTARRAFKRLKRLYGLAGVASQCEESVFDGVIELDFGSLAAFFDRRV